MNINHFKIHVTIYDETEFCYSLDEMYFLYGVKTQDDFDSDSKEFKEYCKAKINYDVVNETNSHDLEEMIAEFWTKKNYGIIYNNDAGATDFTNRKY